MTDDIDPTIGGRVDPPLTGYRRVWNRCRQCGTIAYRDYVPYSLSSPVLVMPCGHTRDGARMDVVDVTEREAFEYILARELKEKASV